MTISSTAVPSGVRLTRPADEPGPFGAPMTLTIHDKGLSTMIDWRNRDSRQGHLLQEPGPLYRLRKWQRRIRVSNATERNLAFALSELDRMASALGLPRNIRETAAVSTVTRSTRT